MKRIAMLAVGLVAAGCDPSPACDEGQRAEIGSCVPLPTDAGGQHAPSPGHDSGADDAGSDGGPEAGCTSGPDHYEGFGDACTADRDCSSCAAPNCATSPLNMCTRLNCQTDAEACPPDWQCTDISMFSGDPSVTHICLKM